MAMRREEHVLSANEAAYVTGVPLKQVHRIIDAGVLDGVVRTRKGTRVIPATALVSLKLAYETAEILTPEGRRWLTRRLLDDPDARIIRADTVSVDVRSMKRDVRQGLAALEKAKKMIVIDRDVLGGSPCFKSSRIAVHDISEMVVNGDDVSAILAAYPMLTKRHIDAAMIYAQACPRRGRPRQEPTGAKRFKL